MIKLKDCLHPCHLKSGSACIQPCIFKLTSILKYNWFIWKMSPQFNTLRWNMHLVSVCCLVALVASLHYKWLSCGLFGKVFLHLFLIPYSECCLELVMMLCSKGQALSNIIKGESFRTGSENISIWFSINLHPVVHENVMHHL